MIRNKITEEQLLPISVGVVSKVLFAGIYLARTSVILRLEAEESPIAKTALCR